MSTSKKKRMGSQRRALNVGESPETSDKAINLPVPQGRQRADATADLTLSPDSAQSETSTRKKKLGSQRGNKEKLQSSHKPTEEVQDSATQSQALGIKNESTDESLESNIKSTFPESEAAGSDLECNEASNVSLSTITEAMSPKSDPQDTMTDTTLLLKVAQTEISSTEEGVLSEKDQAQQMPDIFEATIPAGVTGESSCTVRLIEHEEIIVEESYDHNKQNTEDKAGPVEKPVCIESDNSSLPTAKSRKMGSSRRKKVNLIELQDEDSERAVESDISTALEAPDPTIFDNTQEVNVCVTATGVTYKEEGQVEINLSPKVNKDKTDMEDLCDVSSSNLSEVKDFEEPHTENVLAEIIAQGDQKQESKGSEDLSVSLQSNDLSELSLVEIPPTEHTNASVTSQQNFATGNAFEDVDETKIPQTGENTTLQVCYESEETKKDITNKESLKTTEFAITPEASSSVEPADSQNDVEQPEPLISFSDGVSIVQVYKGEDQDKDVNPKEEEPFDFSLQIPQLVDNASTSTPDINVNDVEEAKILGMEDSPSQPVCDKSLPVDEAAKDDAKEESLNTTAAVQEPIIESDTDLKESVNLDLYPNEDSDKSSVTDDMSESRSESISSTEDEPILDELKPSIEEIQLDQNIDILNISTTTESVDANKNESGLSQTEDVRQITSRSVSETLDETKLGFNIDLLGQQSEPLIDLTDGVSTVSNEPYKENQDLSHEQLVDLQKDMPSESKRTLNPHMEEINALASSSFPVITASVDDVTATWDVQDKKITPNIVIGEIQIESELEEQSRELPMENKNPAAKPDEMDKVSLKIHGESTDNEDLKSTSNPTQESTVVEIKVSDTVQSTEQPLNNETVGEPFENVQKLDADLNAPDTDLSHGPVRRKFGSSRRSKARKDVTQVTTVDDEDAQSAANENLPSSIDVQTDEKSEAIKKEDNINVADAVDAAVRELSSPKEGVELDQMKENFFEVQANILVPDENVSLKVEDGISPSTTKNTSNDFVLSEVGIDENQIENHGQRDESSKLFTIQVPISDDTDATLATTQPDVTLSVEDGSAKDSHLNGDKKLGSSHTPEEKNAETKTESLIEEKGQEMTKEIDVIAEKTQVEPVQMTEISMDSENRAASQDELVKSFIQVHDDALETTEVTTLLGTEKTVDEEISNATDNQVLGNVTEPKSNTQQSDVVVESYTLKETLNVHQLTYISDSETQEEMDNSSLQQAKQPDLADTMVEPSETVKLSNTSDGDAHHSLRRKLGSSRRVKRNQLEEILTDSKDTLSIDNEDDNKVPEFVEASSAEEIISSNVSELDAEPMNQVYFSKPIDTEEQTIDTTQEKEINTQVVSLDEKAIDVQNEIPEVMVDNFTIIDLKDKGIVKAEGLPRDVDVDNTSSQSVARSEEIIRAKTDDAIQSVVISAEDITKEKEGIEVIDVLETKAKLQTNSEPKRKKMGSTRRSQLNKKEQVEEENADLNVLVKPTIDEKDNTPTVSQNYAVEDQHQSKESTERPEASQEDKEKNLQTEAELVEDIDKGATAQTLTPIAGEAIQPSSPSKRRKMGSTRKNVSSKRENPLDETFTPVNLESEGVASVSKDDNDSKGQSGLLVYSAAVHQPPPDEDTPLSQQVSLEKLRSESKVTEMSPQHEAVAEDAAVARRRKMGSHRKPHSDQSVIQRRVADSEESLLHPLGEHRAEAPKLIQVSEVNAGDKDLSSATAFNDALDSRPLCEKISQQPSKPNMRRVQESNIRIAAGLDRSVCRYEVVMIGDSSVGKTSFIQRAQSGRFSPDVPASIGMDSYKWTMAVNGKNIVLHLWDTAGQERFRSMTKQIFHRAQAFLLMYDVTCAQTFTAVSYWANCVKEGAAENAVVLLLGNKSDRMERKVSREEGEILAEENSFAFMECSAATGQNVTEALETVARLLSQRADKSEEPLLLRRPEPKNKLGCC